jgi:hypothetical protein
MFAACIAPRAHAQPCGALSPVFFSVPRSSCSFVRLNVSGPRDALGYIVFQSTEPAFSTARQIATIRAGDSSFARLVLGTNNYFWAAAYNSCGVGTFVGPRIVFGTADAGIVSNVTATSECGSIRLRWTESLPGVGQVFAVYRSSQAVYDASATLMRNFDSHTAFIDTSPSPAQPYYHIITTLFGCSPSPAVSINTTYSYVPLAPRLGAEPVQFTCDAVKITIESRNPCSTTHIISRSRTNDPSTALVVGSTTSHNFLDTGLLPNVTYYYWGTSTVLGVGSDRSSSVAAMTRGAPAPTPPGDPSSAVFVADSGGLLNAFFSVTNPADITSIRWTKDGESSIPDPERVTQLPDGSLEFTSAVPSDAGLYQPLGVSTCGDFFGSPIDVSIDTRVGCPPCSIDYNSDGGVDGSDVQAFLEDWVIPGQCADVNVDGGIDGADVEWFFICWAACSC